MAQKGPRAKKVPMRMCAGCGEMKAKRDMVRVVRTPEGLVDVDPTGKRSGRGVYVCPGAGCLEKAVKGKRLEKSLGQAISEEIYAKLAQGMVK